MSTSRTPVPGPAPGAAPGAGEADVPDWSGVSGLDRAGARRRDPAWVARQWQDPRCRLLEVSDRGELASDAEGGRLRWSGPVAERDPGRHHLLGLTAAGPVFAVTAEPAGPGHQLREVGDRLPVLERDLAATAVALLHWHRQAGFCPVCGGGTEVVAAGGSRVCRRCGEQLFPRTDPAVIVAIRDPADRLLLARQAVWAPGRASILAGFVEAGESLEQTVHREMAEEAGVELSELCYWGSQPWPTPRSLMLGFAARAVDDRVRVDGEELAAGRYWSRSEVDAAVTDGTLLLPPPASIAHRLIAAWRHHTL